MSWSDIASLDTTQLTLEIPRFSLVSHVWGARVPGRRGSLTTTGAISLEQVHAFLTLALLVEVNAIFELKRFCVTVS